MKKKVPRLKTDREAEQFLDQDLTDYLNLKDCTPVTFELLPKTKQVNLRFSEPLLNAVRKRAEQEGISYQKFIRRAVEGSLKKKPKVLA
jgi:predicted DNA binding CopG/RHH family protein